MNTALAREIYGNVPWSVDPSTFCALMNQLYGFKHDKHFSADAEKANGIWLYDMSSGTKILTDPYQLNQAMPEGDDLIYLIGLNGTITKNGGQSTSGTSQLGQQLLKFDNDPRIKGGIMMIDCGGGSHPGLEVMLAAVDQRKKPLISLIERGGGAYSAAYPIAAKADMIMAEDKNSGVGSLGTVMRMSGQPNGTVDSNGVKYVTIYATKSTKKNQAWEEAINNDNYKIALSEEVDPANDWFLGMNKSLRPALEESQMDGSVYKAGDVLGTMVDKIGSFQQAQLELKKMYQQKGRLVVPRNSLTTNSNKVMTASEILSQFPEAHSAIYNAGVAAERDRAGAWMAHVGTDVEAVTKGIKSGNPISQTDSQELIVKAISKGMLGNMQASSAAAITTTEAVSATTTEAVETADDKELAALYGKHGITKMSQLV